MIKMTNIKRIIFLFSKNDKSMKKIIILTVLFLFSCEDKHDIVSDHAVLQFEKKLFLHQLTADSTMIDSFLTRESILSPELNSIELRFNSDLNFRAELFKRIKTKNDSVALDSTLSDLLKKYKSFVLQDSIK